MYNVGNGLHIDVAIKHNPYNIPLGTVFGMALRENKKRRFLFVSKILGKHIPVNPFVPLLGGAALALHYLKAIYNMGTGQMTDIVEALVNQKNYEKVYEKVKSSPAQLPEKAIFLGFAETATALGHAMFDYFPDNGFYIHTTRELINELEVLVKFEEEHSHATSHRLYSTQDFLNSQNQVILIDDEITTGKTALNIIEAIQNVYPRKRYVVVSLLDWRSEEDIQRYIDTEKRLGIEIVSISLISGTINIHERKNPKNTVFKDKNILNSAVIPEIRYIKVGRFLGDKINLSSINSSGQINQCPYISASGRFGISSEQNKNYYKLINNIGTFLRSTLTGNRTLCLGTGEFMFIPMLISSCMGDGVRYHSTTRSPIHAIDMEGYGIRSSYSFESPDDPEITNYLYNIPYNYYDNVYLFFERAVNEENLHPILNVLKRSGIPKIFIVTFV